MCSIYKSEKPKRAMILNSLEGNYAAKITGAFCSEFSTTGSVPAGQAGHNRRGWPGPGAGVVVAAAAAGSLGAGK